MLKPIYKLQANGDVYGNFGAEGGGWEDPAREKLIEFASSNEEREDNSTKPPSMYNPPPVTTVQPASPRKPLLDGFDPWGAATPMTQTTNLLNLEESNPACNSQYSEVNKGRTEASSLPHSTRSSPASSEHFANQFDPFGPLSGDQGDNSLAEIFGNPHAFEHSSSSENLSRSSATGTANILRPSNMSHPPQKHLSAPNIAALGNSSFVPTFSNIPQSSNTANWASQGPAQSRHSTANYSPSRTASATNRRTSPSSGLQTGRSTSPFGSHTNSTGHMQLPVVGKGGSTESDPFADLGNLKQNAGIGASPVKQKPPPPTQGNPPMSNRPTFQHYSQQQTQSHSQSTGWGQSYKPNYSSSIIGDRSERGPRPKTGNGIIYMYTT